MKPDGLVPSDIVKNIIELNSNVNNMLQQVERFGKILSLNNLEML